MSVYFDMLTILKGFAKIYNPDIYLQPSLLFASLICLGETVISSMLKLYLLTSEMSSCVSNREIRSLATISKRVYAGSVEPDCNFLRSWEIGLGYLRQTWIRIWNV